MKFIAIDIGTSFIKGAILDLTEFNLQEINHLPFPDPLPGLAPGIREIDPREIVSRVRQLLDPLLAKTLDCVGLVMCTQLHGLVLANPKGDLLSNLIIWQDERAMQPHPSGQGSYLQVIAQTLGSDRIRQLGNDLRPGLPVCFLYWFAQQGALNLSNVTPLSLANYVLSALGDAPARGIEITNAMAYGALNLETLDWHRDALTLLGLENVGLPEIVPEGEPVTFLKQGSKRIPCYAAVGDSPAALVGAFLQEGELSLNISTGSQVTLIDPTLEFGDYESRPFFDGKYVKSVTTIPAGRALNVLVNLLTEISRASGQMQNDAWAYIDQAAAAVPETNLDVDLSFFKSAYGERGSITNIKEAQLTIGHVFRAAFESMARNYYRSALRVAPSRTWKNLVFSGGLVQKLNSLREIIIAKFESPYRINAQPEDTLLGLMALALMFSGRTPSVEASVRELQTRF